jgi:HD superfamily phosphohydrolase
MDYSFLQEHIESDIIQSLKNKHQLSLQETEPKYNPEHNRFKHSVEASEYLQKIINYLIEKGEEFTDIVIEIALIAILYHDCGHSALCHKLEKAFKNKVFLQKDVNNKKSFKHETMTCKILESVIEDSSKLEMIQKLIDGESKYYNNVKNLTRADKFIISLISNNVDVDRLQYLNMDSKFLNAREELEQKGIILPNISIDELLENIIIHRNKNVKIVIRKTFEDQLLKVRDIMYANYYEKIGRKFIISDDDIPFYEKIISNVDIFINFTDSDIEYCEENNTCYIKQSFKDKYLF